MMFPWQAGIAVFALIGLVAGRMVAGPPRDHTGGLGQYLFGDRFGLTFALTTGALVTMASLGWGFGRVYVIRSSTDWSVKWAIGSPKYEFSNGNTVDVQTHAVVNDTSEPLILESVAYGNGSTRSNVPIHPHSAATFDQGVIHYFFTDAPPSSIKSKSGGATQWWLHRL